MHPIQELPSLGSAWLFAMPYLVFVGVNFATMGARSAVQKTRNVSFANNWNMALALICPPGLFWFLMKKSLPREE